MSAIRTQKKKKARKGSSNQSQQDRILRQFGRVNTRQHTLLRRMGAVEYTVSTNASGVIASNVIAGSNIPFVSCPDFASTAGLYQLYRVHAIEVKFFPLYLAPVYNGVNVTTCPAYACITPYYNNFGVTSLQGHIDATDMRTITGYTGGTFTTSFRGDPEAHFWTPVNTAVPVAESFGLIMQGTSTASTASIVVWRYLAWYLVEFKMAS